MKPQEFYSILILMALFLIVAYAMIQDAKTERLEHSFYCGMVEAGHWPPYKGECKDGE